MTLYCCYCGKLDKLTTDRIVDYLFYRFRTMSTCKEARDNLTHSEYFEYKSYVRQLMRERLMDRSTAHITRLVRIINRGLVCGSVSRETIRQEI